MRRLITLVYVNIIRLLAFSLLLSSGLSANENSIDFSDITDRRQQEIRYFVRHDCGSCHGMSLKGGLGPAITAEALRAKTEFYIFQTIRDGHPGTPMPPWEGIFTEKELHFLVNILKQG